MQLHTTADKSIMKRALDELNGSMTRVAAERDLQKEIKNKIKETIGVEPKVTTKLAKIFYDQNLQEVEDNANEVFSLYDTVVNEPAIQS